MLAYSSFFTACTMYMYEYLFIIVMYFVRFPIVYKISSSCFYTRMCTICLHVSLFVEANSYYYVQCILKYIFAFIYTNVYHTFKQTDEFQKYTKKYNGQLMKNKYLLLLYYNTYYIVLSLSHMK